FFGNTNSAIPTQRAHVSRQQDFTLISKLEICSNLQKIPLYSSKALLKQQNNKKADKLSLFSFTTGGSKEKYATRGDIRYLLWPMQHGIMHFCGVKVLEPHICYAPASVSEEKRKEMLTAWTQRLKTLWKEEPIDCSPEWYFKDKILGLFCSLTPVTCSN
ncbi:Ribosyldihydronicotinamide dehydrogenase, partial [Lamprotornis superbus]